MQEQQQWASRPPHDTVPSSSTRCPVGRLLLATFVLMAAIGTEAFLLPAPAALVYVHVWPLLPLDLGLAGLAFVLGCIALYWRARH